MRIPGLSPFGKVRKARRRCRLRRLAGGVRTLCKALVDSNESYRKKFRRDVPRMRHNSFLSLPGIDQSPKQRLLSLCVRVMRTYLMLQGSWIAKLDEIHTEFLLREVRARRDAITQVVLWLTDITKTTLYLGVVSGSKVGPWSRYHGGRKGPSRRCTAMRNSTMHREYLHCLARATHLSRASSEDVCTNVTQRKETSPNATRHEPKALTGFPESLRSSSRSLKPLTKS